MIVTSIYGKKFIQFQSALQRMINRNQGKAGFSVSVFSFFFYKLWLITSSFFVLMFPVFQLRIKLAFHVFFLFISTNEYFLSPMHMKNWMNYTYVVVLLPSLHIIDIFLKLVIRGLILGQAENHFNFSEYFKNSPREN